MFPVRALSRHVRGAFVSRLRHLADGGGLERIRDTGGIDTMLDTLMANDWVVYSKPCLTHTETVVAYLSRYTHRIALSDSRLLDFADGRVELAYHDYRDGEHKVMRLEADELLRRYLLHVLPKGFMRIRSFGFLANRCRRQRLAQIRGAIATAAVEPTDPDATAEAEPADGYPCPKCGQGILRVIRLIEPKPWGGGSRMH